MGAHRGTATTSHVVYKTTAMQGPQHSCYAGKSTECKHKAPAQYNEAAQVHCSWACPTVSQYPALWSEPRRDSHSHLLALSQSVIASH
jgi:hypothetical protein